MATSKRHELRAWDANVLRDYIKSVRKKSFSELRRLEKEMGRKFSEVEKANFLSKFRFEEMTRKK